MPPTPPFWLKGGLEREVITRFFCRCCRRIIQKNHGMTSTLLTGTLFGLLDWCLQIRKSVALIQITKNFSNKYISIFYAPWQTSMFSIQISSQVHQKIALGLYTAESSAPRLMSVAPWAASKACPWPSLSKTPRAWGTIEIGTGGHPSVLKSHKTREGASRTSV